MKLTQIASNLSSVDLGANKIFYSYETPVALLAGGKLIVSQNIWSVTTGKHLTKIDHGTKEAKAARVTSAVFAAELAKLGA